MILIIHWQLIVIYHSMTGPRTKALEVRRKIENHFCLGADRLYSESGGCCPQRPPHGFSAGKRGPGKNWFTDQYQQQAAREIVKVHWAAADCLWWWSGKCAQVPTLLTYNICGRHARYGKQEVYVHLKLDGCQQNNHQCNGWLFSKDPSLSDKILYWITLG